MENRLETLFAQPLGAQSLLQRGGSGWLDSVRPSLSGAWRIADYAAVRRVVRLL
jgi:hypothetical protein